jgi:hypothetical protein
VLDLRRGAPVIEVQERRAALERLLNAVGLLHVVGVLARIAALDRP